MQIVKDHAKVERFGGQTKANFQIAGTTQAFEILSDGLYSNKIKAVIRELSTNAVDAHVALWVQQNPGVKISRQIIAGLPQYNVHMPNRLEPFFSIRDFGIGLSHDEVMKMYVTYFHSNKCTSNDYVGCLGLGSKSPFAYTDTFTIVSHYNGEKLTYMAVIENGFPDVSVVTGDDGEPLVEKTNEPNGLEIKIPVRSEDFTAFADEAMALYPHFILKPKLSGNAYVKVKDIKYVLTGDYWGVREKDSKGPMAIMGNIAYPIDRYNLRDLPNSVASLLQTDIDIQFDIGTLQITPSREALSYKPTTITTIIERGKLILGDMQKHVDKAFEDCKSMWDARCLARTLFYGYEGLLSQLTKILTVAEISYKGQKLGSHEVYLHKSHSSEPKIGGLEIVEFYHARKRGYHSQNNTTVKQKNDPASFEPDADITFVEMDIPRGAFARCKFAMEEAKYKKILALRFANSTARAEFIDLVGLAPDHKFVLTSDMEKPPTAAAGTRYSNSSQLFKHNGQTDGWRHYDFWDSATVNLNDGGVYVEMCRYKVWPPSVKEKTNLTLQHPSVVGEIIKALAAIGVKVDVYGVRSGLVKKFRKSDDWVDLWTFTKNTLQTLLSKNDMDKHVANAKEYQSFYNASAYNKLAEHFKPKHKTSQMAQFLELLDELKASTKLVPQPGKYTSLADRVGYKFEVPKTHNLSQQEKALNLVYPMLSLVVGNLGLSGVPAKVADYVNLLDN